MSKVDKKLLEKYSSTGPRYTSYPPATFFDTNFSNEGEVYYYDQRRSENFTVSDDTK